MSHDLIAAFVDLFRYPITGTTNCSMPKHRQYACLREFQASVASKIGLHPCCLLRYPMYLKPYTLLNRNMPLARVPQEARQDLPQAGTELFRGHRICDATERCSRQRALWRKAERAAAAAGAAGGRRTSTLRSRRESSMSWEVSVLRFACRMNLRASCTGSGKGGASAARRAQELDD